MGFYSLFSEGVRDGPGPHHVYHMVTGGRASCRTSSELYLPLLHGEGLECCQFSGVGQEGGITEDGMSTTHREQSWSWALISGFCSIMGGGHSGAESGCRHVGKEPESGPGGGKKGEEERRGEKDACPVASLLYPDSRMMLPTCKPSRLSPTLLLSLVNFPRNPFTDT